MKFKYSLIMSMILLALLSSTVYLAMHNDRKNDACEAVLEKTLYLSLNESAALEGEISLSENEEIIEAESPGQQVSKRTVHSIPSMSRIFIPCLSSI